MPLPWKRKGELEGWLATAICQAMQADAMAGMVRSLPDDLGEVDVRKAKARLQPILKAIYVRKNGGRSGVP